MRAEATWGAVPYQGKNRYETCGKHAYARSGWADKGVSINELQIGHGLKFTFEPRTFGPTGGGPAAQAAAPNTYPPEPPSNTATQEDVYRAAGLGVKALNERLDKVEKNLGDKIDNTHIERWWGIPAIYWIAGGLLGLFALVVAIMLVASRDRKESYDLDDVDEEVDETPKEKKPLFGWFGDLFKEQPTKVLVEPIRSKKPHDDRGSTPTGDIVDAEFEETGDKK
jgi:hypothetical protein